MTPDDSRLKSKVARLESEINSIRDDRSNLLKQMSAQAKTSANLLSLVSDQRDEAEKLLTESTDANAVLMAEIKVLKESNSMLGNKGLEKFLFSGTEYVALEAEIQELKAYCANLINVFHTIYYGKNPNAVGMEEGSNMAVRYHMQAHHALSSTPDVALNCVRDTITDMKKFRQFCIWLSKDSLNYPGTDAGNSAASLQKDLDKAIVKLIRMFGDNK